jgi:hypothetical protein
MPVFSHSLAPHLPLAIAAGIGSIGWIADLQTAFLRELNDCSIFLRRTPRRGFLKIRLLRIAFLPELVNVTYDRSVRLGRCSVGLQTRTEERMNFSRLVAGAVIAQCLAVLSEPAAHADGILTYIGNDFTFFISAYTSTDKVTASITLANPLADNLNLAPVTPLAFSLNDGVQTISNRTAPIITTFDFSTNATGEITEWDVGARFPSPSSGIYFSIGTTNSPEFIGDSGIIARDTFTGFNHNDPGIWTATAVGDPHFTTYGGVHYDYQGIGDFLLTRSTIPGDQFDVQIRTTGVSNAGTAVITEAVATLCNHNVTFDVDRASAGGSLVWIDGSPTLLNHDDPILTLGSCKIAELSNNIYEVDWNTGEILDVTDNGTYLDLSSSLSWIDGLGVMEGLLTSNINPDAWRVTEGSLFETDPVPEPTTLSLIGMGIGLTAIAMMRRPSLRRAT